MRIRDGDTSRVIYFVAVDATDLKTRETSLTGTDVWYELDGGTVTQMTTPTITAVDATNAPGVFDLAIDESGMVTLAAGEDSVELMIHIEATEMAPVTRVIEIYRREVTTGNTLDVTATGAAGIDWGNIENPTTSQTLSSTTVGTTTTNTDMRGTDNAALASVLGSLADAAATGDPTASDTVMQYVKQLVNLLAGTAGIATMPAAADPANGVNLFEMLRAAMGSTFATATDSLEQLQADHVTLQSDTDDIQTRLPAALVGGAMNADVSAMQTDAISAAALSAAAVTKITDDVMSDVLTEPSQAIPPTTGVADVADALRYLYFALTNRVDVDDTAGAKEFYNRAESAVQWKKAISDSGTVYTEDTGAAGP